MATYSKLANVIIALATASFERKGFGTPLFLSAHRFSKGRTIIVTKETFAQELPTYSNAYKAASTAFAQPNGLSQLIIGRIEADSVVDLPEVPVQNQTFKLTIEVNDGNKLDVEYTEASASPTKEVVLTAIKGLIDGDADVAAHVTATVAGSDDAATLTITPKVSDSDFFILTGLDNLTQTFTATESIDVAFTEVKNENDNFYAVGSEDKSNASVELLAQTVNAFDKQYWFTTDSVDCLEPLADPATDLLGTIKAGNFERVVGGYHQDAQTTFPEMGALAYNLPYLAGTIVWGNDRTSGISASRQANGALINLTQKQALLDRNAFFWDEQGGNVFVNSDVKSSSGDRPENVRGRDNMKVDIQANVSELLLNQIGTKIPYNNLGIAQIESVVDAALQVYVQRGFIEPNYVISSPDARLIAGGIKATQKLDNMTFVAQLSGAITMVDAIRGVLQLEEVVQ